jgi:hypothetical protein
LFQRAPGFTQTAQPLQSQPQLVVPNLKTGVHAEGAAQQWLGRGVISRAPQCKSMQHHQAGIIGILMPGFSTQVSCTLRVLISEGVAGLREKCLDG